MSILFLSVTPWFPFIAVGPPGAAPADKEHTLLFLAGAGGQEQRCD